VHTLHHTWTTPGGSPGRDESPTNPLNRATAQLLQYGKPFPRLCMCFFKDARGTLRWLGVFVHSAGSRVLFFPGFADTFKEVQHGFKAKSQRNQPFDFDHVSLENDLQSWHITSARSEDHIGKPRTLDIGKSRVLWFGMSVADANVLRIVREETRITSVVQHQTASVAQMHWSLQETVRSSL
jgi:hypothetical protein